MGKLSVLHISDLHIGNFVYPNVNDLAISLVEAMEDHQKKVNCVVVSGDIFDGKSKNTDKDIKDAVGFFKQLRIELNKKCAKNLKPSDFLFVPGNHDQIRTEDGDTLVKFKTFLKEFYSRGYFEKNYHKDHLFTIKIFEDKKIAMVGLNSCMIEKQPLIDKETKWLDAIPFKDKDEKQNIIETLETQGKWDDYGMISKSQLRDAFDDLSNKLNDPNEYTILACFHHHFYPFPEIYDKYGDSSLIRNFSNVIDKLQKSNVKVVLHGHKHIPIIRPVTNQKYLTDPNSMLYVFSAGSIGKKDVSNRSFQIVDLYSPDNNRIAEVHRFNYKFEELETPESFCFPPRRKYEQHDYIMLIEVLQAEFSDDYDKYLNQIHEFDNISQNLRVDEIIKNISQTITSFDAVKKDLKQSSKSVLTLLLSVHYRVNALSSQRSSTQKASKAIINKIRKLLHEVIDSEDYEKKLFKLLEANTTSEFEKHYDDIEKDASRNERMLTAYSTIAIFFTDLYLTLSQYGEFYYKKEGLNANIKLDENTFQTNIPVTTIKISSDVERRSSFIQFKCKNPTVHKIAVLIVKEFEKRINKIEDSFKILDLKIYYLSPKIEKDNYDLENFNFEAYIPTLLPLLTGDNLYKQKEVFIRELLQNSLDAILLRAKVDKNNGIDKTIRLTLGKEKNPKSGKLRKFLRISDNGVGMDEFKIERYFTSIGRSFYVSDEFEELQKSEEIEYRPISNFGIGFLSAFMVCKEIHVVTKSYDKSSGLEIQIPNFDGCFFINKTDDKQTGTSITLYEDERKLLNSKNIIEYIKQTMLDFQLDIEIIDKISNKSESWQAHHVKHNCTLPLFVPLTDTGMEKISWVKEVQTGKFISDYDFGLLLDFRANPYKKKQEAAFLNSGILLSNVPEIPFKYPFCNQYYNFPSSYIELDVSREKIMRFKNNHFQLDKALQLLAIQAGELIDYSKAKSKDLPISALDNVYRFFIHNGLNNSALRDLKGKLFHLSIKVLSDDTISVSLDPSRNQSVTWVATDYQGIFKLLVKCLTLFMTQVREIREKQKGLFPDEFYDIIDELAKWIDTEIPGRLKAYDRKGNIQSFEKKFSPRFEEEFFYRFEKEFLPRFEEEFFHRFENGFSLRFDEGFFHIFDGELSYKFEQEFFHGFEKDLSHRFEEEFFPRFEREFSPQFEEEFLHKNRIRMPIRHDNKYQGLLYNLLLSSFLFQRRRNRRFSIADLYLRLYYFYFILSGNISIGEVNKFELKF